MDGTTGEIRMFAGDFAPLYWAFCDGRELAVAEHVKLFTLLGFTYGGDGFTTFKVPRMADVVPGVRYIMCTQGQGSAP